MPIFKIHHITFYQYDRPVKENINQVKIFPVEDGLQEVTEFGMVVTGDPFIHTYFDFFGNKVGDFNVHLPHTELSIDCRMTVKTADRSLSHDSLPVVTLAELKKDTDSQIFLFRMADPERISSKPQIDSILQVIGYKELSVKDIARSCCNYVYTNFKYQKGITNIETTVDEILDHRFGVCQDFAHVLIGCLRSMGLPARYVSGYLETVPPPGQEKLVGADASHAWVSLFCGEELGWIDLDPTNDVLPGDRHITIAWGRDFSDVSPLRGVTWAAGEQWLLVGVDVKRLE